MSETLITVLFLVFVLAVLIIDLGVFQRKAHFPKFKEALVWSSVWISLALLFNVFVYFRFGEELALQFFTGYVIEKALSVDNIFVFILIFSYFAVPSELQHKVLFWGVIGAIIFRAIFILLGAALIEQFHWILYLFGAFLVFTAIKLAMQKGDDEIKPEKNPFVKFCKKIFPITPHYEGSKFFIRKNGKYHMTPLFLVLVVVESTDVAFATDSIPAIFAITRDPFIVFTSNIFAILGLRSLYFVLANFMKKFRFLKIGLSVVLGFIGLKMLVEFFDVHIPIVASLLTICFVLLTSVLTSILIPERNKHGAS
ncbi:MAG: TerC family protein [Ignavibacteriae bacterium]|nr:TerC family protein [Ignavibacteriota bacterium]